MLPYRVVPLPVIMREQGGLYRPFYADTHRISRLARLSSDPSNQLRGPPLTLRRC